MSRLHKQCFYASAGLHLLLLVAVIFGAGFLPEKPMQLDMEPFHMMPASVIESLLDDPADVQGEPQPEPEPVVEPVQPPPAVEEAAPEPKPEPQPEPKPEPEPVKEVVKQPKIEVPKENTISKKEEPKEKPKQKKPIHISTTFKPNTAQASDRKTPVVKTVSPPRRNPAADFDPGNIERIGKGSTIKGITTVLGSSLGNYGLKVQAAYDRQWTQYANLSKSNATVQVRVVVGTDGSIVSSKLVKPSGIAAFDRSIEQVMDRVSRIPEPPPSGASLSDRTFTLNFNIN